MMRLFPITDRNFYRHPYRAFYGRGAIPEIQSTAWITCGRDLAATAIALVISVLVSLFGGYTMTSMGRLSGCYPPGAVAAIYSVVANAAYIRIA